MQGLDITQLAGLLGLEQSQVADLGNLKGPELKNQFNQLIAQVLENQDEVSPELAVPGIMLPEQAVKPELLKTQMPADGDEQTLPQHLQDILNTLPPEIKQTLSALLPQLAEHFPEAKAMLNNIGLQDKPEKIHEKLSTIIDKLPAESIPKEVKQQITANMEAMGGKEKFLDLASQTIAASAKQAQLKTSEFEPGKLQLPSHKRIILATPASMAATAGLAQGQGMPQALGQGYHLDAAAPKNISIEQHIDQAAWREALAEKVLWMGNQTVKRAAVHIHPPELGPLEVTLKMSKENATVAFSSQHLPVRDAIEQALPRLREMFQEQGLNLNHVDISDFSKQHSQFQDRANEASELAQSKFENSNADLEANDHAAVVKKLGLVDYFV
jgi:flagellar hook-length control protein FliK